MQKNSIMCFMIDATGCQIFTSLNGKLRDIWGINLYLENVQVRIQVRIKPDIFLRFSNLNIFAARFTGYNLSYKITFLSGLM